MATYKPGGLASLMDERGFTALLGEFAEGRYQLFDPVEILRAEYPGYATQTYQAVARRIAAALAEGYALSTTGQLAPGGASGLPTNPNLPRDYRSLVVITVLGADGVARAQTIVIDSDSPPSLGGLEADAEQLLDDYDLAGYGAGAQVQSVDVLYIFRSLKV